MTYFCDNDFQKIGRTIEDIKIIKANELKNINDEDKNIIIVASKYYREISRQLIDMEIRNFYCHEEIFNGFYYFMFLYLDFYYTEDIIMNKYNINKVLQMLDDNKSKRVLENIILHRLSGNFEYIFNISDNLHIDYFSNNIPQYLDKDIINFSNNESIVDCGAFTGDTIEEIIKLYSNNFEKIYAFEPDRKNYIKLEKNIDKFNFKEKIELFNLGISDKKEKLRFNGDNLKSSGVSESGTEYVDFVKLDEFLFQRITFLKMDIEGMEKKAILGAKKIIKKYKPKLAICIYHNPKDIFEIPLLIKSIVPEYKIYIRHYSMDIGETVCYAVV